MNGNAAWQMAYIRRRWNCPVRAHSPDSFKDRSSSGKAAGRYLGKKRARLFSFSHRNIDYYQHYTDVFFESDFMDLSKIKVNCPGRDSNPHTSLHQNLNLACLPISPPGQIRML